MAIDLDLISALSIIAPLTVGAIFYSRLMSASKVIFLIVVTTLFFDIIGKVLAHQGLNNMILFHIYTFAEFALILTFYRRLTPTISWIQMLTFFALLFFLFSSINLILYANLFEFNSLQRNIEALILIVIFVRFLSDILKSNRKIALFSNPFFIQTCGFMFYFGGTIYLFTFGIELLKNEQNSFWLIHAFFNIIINLTYTYTLWKGKIRL